MGVWSFVPLSPFFPVITSTRLPFTLSRIHRPAADQGTIAAGPFGDPTMPSVPYVIEQHGREERVFDIYSRLLKDRIIFLLGEVDDESANLIVAQMLYL